MKKFNVGDKVKIIQRKRTNSSGTQPGWNEPNGNVGEIGYVGRIEGGYCIYRTKDKEGYFGWFDDDDLELVSEEVSTTPYVKGKWYGCKDWRNKHDYVKLDYIYSDKTRIYFTECIDDTEYRQINDWWGIEKKELFEADMSIVSQFLPQGHPDKIYSKEFVLPSKWCVKVDKNSQPEEVYKWRDIRWSDAGYICYDKHWNHRVYSTHTEITLEQFKQHVLKESPVVKIPKEIDMQAIQEEAKKRFPIGCKFIPVGDIITYTLIEDDCTYTIHNNYIWASDSHGSLYENGKWATLVSLPESKEDMFYAGDYIVTLINEGDCGKVNYCSKQREDSSVLKPEIDTSGHRINGNPAFKITDKSFTKWRYATPEEAAEYERIGKPYDVTTLQKKEESIPEYVECIRGLNNATVGKIYKVIDATNCESNIPTQKYSWQTPDYIPSTKEAYEAQNAILAEYIPQVGDYVVMEKAGGWGYSPHNNGCIAIVEKVSTREVGHFSKLITVPSIGGQVINPKKLGDVVFTNIPIIGLNKERIFRKALPHEIPNDLPKSTVIEEWSEGTYAVGVKGNFGVYTKSDNLVPVGKIFTIKENRENSLVVKDHGFWIYKENLRWFATYEEALNFSNQLKASPPPMWSSDPIVEERINTPSIKKETFIENVQSVNVMLRTKKKSIKF